MANRVRHARISLEIKNFIVKRLACFESPTQVAHAVRERFAIDITPQAVEGYDPDKVTGKSLCEELTQLFRDERTSYLASVSNLGCFHQTYRMQILQSGIDAFLARGNFVGAAQLAAQAAREAGGLYKARALLLAPGAARGEFSPTSPQDAYDYSQLDENELNELEKLLLKMLPPKQS